MISTMEHSHLRGGGRLASNHWRARSGSAPPSTTNDKPRGQAGFIESKNQNVFQPDEFLAHVVSLQVAIAKFGAQSQLLPHLLPGEIDRKVDLQESVR